MEMEIERKFTVKALPEHLERYDCLRIEQAYLNTNPVIRIRRENDTYYLTYKGKGLLAREEYNLPLNEASYRHLLAKADGNVISKKRYLIPLGQSAAPSGKEADIDQIGLKIELDVFEPPFSPLVIAEVEFPTQKAAEDFLPPSWFLNDVTYDPAYHNSTLSRMDLTAPSPEPRPWTPSPEARTER